MSIYLNISEDDLIRKQCNEVSVANGFPCLEQFKHPRSVELFVWLSFCLLIMTALIGNLIVMLIIINYKAMQNGFNYFLFNISLADFLITLLNTGSSWSFNFYYVWNYPHVFCPLNHFFGISPTCSSIFSLMVLSLDRCSAVVDPLRKQAMSKKSALTKICFIWFASTVISLPSVLGAKIIPIYYLSTDGAVKRHRSCQVDFKYKALYDNMLFVVQYILPLVVLIVTYTRIIKALNSHKVPNSTQINTGTQQLRDKKKVVKMLGLIVTIFMILWAPYHAYHLTADYWELDPVVNTYCYLLFYWMAMSSCCFNPLIYCTFNARFRIGFRYVFRFLPCVEFTQYHREKMFPNSRTPTVRMNKLTQSMSSPLKLSSSPPSNKRRSNSPNSATSLTLINNEANKYVTVAFKCQKTPLNCPFYSVGVLPAESNPIFSDKRSVLQADKCFLYIDIEPTMETPKSTQQRGRSKTDSALTSSSSALLADSTTELPYRLKARLYELFSQIDREFEALTLENYQLKLRLGQQNPDSSLNELLKSYEAPTSTEISQKLAGKKQNWRTALRPPNPLLTNLKNSRVKNYSGHNDAVLFLASCSNYGRSLLGTASADQSARVFDAKNGNCLMQLCHESGAVNSIAIRPDANGQFNILTGCGDRKLHLWRMTSFSDSNLMNSSGDELELDAVSEKLNEPEDEHFTPVPMVIRQPIATYGGHTDAVVGADWLAGADQIVSASWDRTSNLYDLNNEAVVSSLTGHEDKLTFCSTSSTTKIVATASLDCTFRLWDFRESMRSVAIFQGHNSSVNSVIFNSTNQLISGSDDKTIWDLRNMRNAISTTRFESSVNKVSASNKNIAVPLDNRNVYILDLHGNRVCRIHRSNGHAALVEATVWLEDVENCNLVSCGIDKQVIGWNVQLSGRN
ncbi:WD repeat-containing protein 37 [Aphelenchoides bicaudatus]|nr:WD repeat-containing protein 37 [Aphelenchoides bicaudatus]